MIKDTQNKFYPVLLPFAFLYGIVIRVRNLLFDWDLLPSQKFTIPVICIGNLAVGGTGKTPLVDYLVQVLSKKYRLAVLSRGYKRKTSGYVLANEHHTSSDIGDEACQLKKKYPFLIVAVDNNRRRGMKYILDMPEDIKPQVVLLDDGYQHRFVKPSFSILITDYCRLFYRDVLLPAGRLREPVKSISRANMILVSKCPNELTRTDCRMIEKEIKQSAKLPIFFTSISYQELKGVFPKVCNPLKIGNIRNDTEILLITGIANSTPIIEEIKKYSEKVSVMSFNDHHEFSKKDIAGMQTVMSKMTNICTLIICTEKDAARIRNNPYFPDEWKSHLYYLPMQVSFLFDCNAQFENLIMRHIGIMESN